MRNKCLFLFLLIFQVSGAQNLSLEVVRRMNATRDILQRYLVKGDSLFPFFEVGENGIEIFSSPIAKQEKNSEFVLYWNELNAFNQIVKSIAPDSLLKLYKEKGKNRWDDSFLSSIPKTPPYIPAPNPHLPLLGMKIALDPGHIGGNAEVAFWEKKMVKIRKEELNGFPADILFNEGNLCLGTALILKEKLEKAGAQVFMTRSKPGETAYGISYPEWIENHFPLAFENYAKEKNLSAEERKAWLNKAGPEEIFLKLFRNLDLQERARKINEWNPDITLFIHYNVKESNRMDKDAFIHAVYDNFNMVFIPGAFMNHELDSLESRINFLRLLVGNDIEQSKDLSKKVLDEFKRMTNVPIVPAYMEDSLSYLKNASIRTEFEGVYARNLALNESVKGIICFGESLYQDNKEECIRLFSIDYNIQGFRVSPRVREVAEAYYQGLLHYVTGKRN